MADQFLHETPVSLSCKRGCSNCCSHAIHVTMLEGIIAYRYLVRRGLWTPSLRVRLEAHADRTWDLAIEMWHLANIPCPLLDGSSCMVYQARPFMCRITSSRGDPEMCHAHRVNDPATGLLPRKGALHDFFEKQRVLLRRHKAPLLLFPVSKAILYAEKIVNGEVDVEYFLQIVAQDLR
jgi:Fe-S-cluster containining protein